MIALPCRGCLKNRWQQGNRGWHGRSSTGGRLGAQLFDLGAQRLDVGAQASGQDRKRRFQSYGYLWAPEFLSWAPSGRPEIGDGSEKLFPISGLALGAQFFDLGAQWAPNLPAWVPTSERRAPSGRPNEEVGRPASQSGRPTQYTGRPASIAGRPASTHGRLFQALRPRQGARLGDGLGKRAPALATPSYRETENRSPGRPCDNPSANTGRRRSPVGASGGSGRR